MNRKWNYSVIDLLRCVMEQACVWPGHCHFSCADDTMNQWNYSWRYVCWCNVSIGHEEPISIKSNSQHIYRMHVRQARTLCYLVHIRQVWSSCSKTSDVILSTTSSSSRNICEWFGDKMKSNNKWTYILTHLCAVLVHKQLNDIVLGERRRKRATKRETVNFYRCTITGSKDNFEFASVHSLPSSFLKKRHSIFRTWSNYQFLKKKTQRSENNRIFRLNWFRRDRL